MLNVMAGHLGDVRCNIDLVPVVAQLLARLDNPAPEFVPLHPHMIA